MIIHIIGAFYIRDKMKKEFMMLLQVSFFEIRNECPL